MISASIRHRFLWIRIVCCILVILDFSTESSAFQINIMSEYKPPLKSSVNQLQSGRFGREDRRTLSFFNKRTSKSAFAGTLSMPSSQGGVQTFEGRMRDLVMGDRRTAEPSTAHRHLPSNLQIIESLKDYKRVVADEKEKIVAVRFYASYCKACQAVAPHFYHLATQFPDVIFVDVPISDKNAALHQGLGINTLPFAHIYHPTGLVEEQKLTRNDITAFRVKLHSYVTGGCPIPKDKP